MAVNIGMCFGPSFPPGFVIEVAERLEEADVDQLWVIEDVFYTTGVTLAAAALARTERLTVGIGILPAVARNAAITAMEFATLARLAPGRLIGGIGHGVQDWMHQMGARPASPVTALDEVLTVVRRLLRGEHVTFDGQHVTLRGVALDQPPAQTPPVLAGVRGPKSLAMAGRCADGLVLAEGAGPGYVRHAIAQAGDPDPFRVSVFSVLCAAQDRRDAYRAIAPFVAAILAPPTPNVLAHPEFDDLLTYWQRHGTDALVDMPPRWWSELGAVGTLDDAVAHVEALHDAGAADVSLAPAPDVETAWQQIDDVVSIANAVR